MTLYGCYKALRQDSYQGERTVMVDAIYPLARHEIQEAWFQPMGLHLRVLTNHPTILAIAETSFRGFGPACPVTTPDITLRLFTHSVDDDQCQAPVFRAAGPMIYWTTGQASMLVADRVHGLAWGYFSPQVLAQPASLRHHFLEPAFHVMLQQRGFMAVHAAACVKNGRAVLLRAPSGGGKTTLAYASARSRLQALAEDAVSINVHTQVWWGMPWRFHLLPSACQLFPELSPSLPVVEIQGQRRLEVELETIRPGSTTIVARPGPVVLLRRLPGGYSRLRPLAFAEARELWFERWSGAETEFAGYYRHVDELLRHDTYRLDFGDDIDRAVELLESLLHI
jgi:hypothetical protein